MFLSICSQVWSLEQPDWHCKIDEGSIGLVSSRWSPDGRHILNTTEFNVSMVVGGVRPALCELLLPINKDLKITDSPKLNSSLRNSVESQSEYIDILEITFHNSAKMQNICC